MAARFSRASISALVISLIAATSPANAATVKAGAACTKAGQVKSSKGAKYTCAKSGKKLIWKLAKSDGNSAAPAPTASPTAAPTASPSPAPTSAAAPTIWSKNGLTKPASLDAIIKSASDSFARYTANIRSDVTVKVVAQSGVDPLLASWVQDGANFVAKRFAYPKLTRQFVNVIASDVKWLEETYTKEGFSVNEVRDRVGGFNAGAPAFGGSNTNTWNFATITKNNLMVRNRTGMAQTAGHEFFHAIQEVLAKGNNPGVKGENIPNWYWEGPAQFVGLQTAATLGYFDYRSAGREEMTSRYRNGAAINRTSNLSDIRENDGVKDPYAIGFAATELLVALVGMEKMIAVYEALGSTRDFAPAFQQGTGIALADFLEIFEEMRETLGFARG